MPEPKPKFQPSADLLELGAVAAKAQAKKFAADISEPVSNQPASPDASLVGGQTSGAGAGKVEKNLTGRRRKKRTQPKNTTLPNLPSVPTPEPKTSVPPIVASVPALTPSDDSAATAIEAFRVSSKLNLQSGKRVFASEPPQPIGKAALQQAVSYVPPSGPSVSLTTEGALPVAAESAPAQAQAPASELELPKRKAMAVAVEAALASMAGQENVPEGAASGSFEVRAGARYRATNNGVLRTISKEVKKNGKEIYYETFDTGERTGYKSLEALNKVAREDGWQLESESATAPEAVPATPSQKAPENAEVSKFKDLEDALEEARNNYAKHDFEQTSILRKISRVLRLDNTKYQGLDVDGAKAAYDNAFQALLTARLSDIHRRKDTGELSEENYKREMGQTLMSFECEGRIKIFQARQQVKMESLAQSKIGWLVEYIPKLAHAYNKLPKRYRYGIAITLGLGTMATLGTGAAAFAPIMVGVRRVLTGATTFATLDTALESLSDRYHEGKVEKSGDAAYTEFAELEKGERTPEQVAEAKRAFLEGRMGGIHEQFKRRKIGMIVRKNTALAAGFFMGSGYMQEKIQGWVKEGGDWLKTQEKLQSWLKSGLDWFQGGVPPIEAHRGDSTWKLLGQYLSAKDSHFAGMSEAQKTYAIDVLKDKLAAMSPDQLKVAGYGSGDISMLGVGERINFDKLVGGNVAEAIKGASGLSAEAAESIVKNNAAILEWSKAHSGVKLTDTLIDNNILHGDAGHTLAGKIPPAWANEPGDDFNNTDGYTVRETPAEENMDDPVFDTSSDAQTQSSGADAPKEADSDSSSDAQTQSSGAEATENETATVTRDEGSVKNADIEYERDIRLGKAYDIDAYKEYFAKNPEDFGEFKKLGEGYLEYISQGDTGEMRALSGKTFRELGSTMSDSLGRFVVLAREAYGSKLGLPSPKEKVYEYVARMAMLGMEHPTGRRILLPQFI